MDLDKIVAAFEHYLALESHAITRAIAEQRMLEKLNRSLREDIAPLLPVGIVFTEEDAITAFERIWVKLIGHLKGEPWKLSARVIEDVRRIRDPHFLQE